MVTAWLGPLLSYVAPALLLRACGGQLTAPQPAPLLWQEPPPSLLRGPVACRCVPGPWAGPAAFLQRLAEEEATGQAGRCPRGPPAPRRQGHNPCLCPARLQPASPHPLLQAFPRSQSPEAFWQHGLTRPCPWGEPGPSGGRLSAPGRYPTESPSSLALRVARRRGRPPSGLKRRFLLGAAVYGLCNAPTIWCCTVHPVPRGHPSAPGRGSRGPRSQAVGAEWRLRDPARTAGTQHEAEPKARPPCPRGSPRRY